MISMAVTASFMGLLGSILGLLCSFPEVLLWLLEATAPKKELSQKLGKIVNGLHEAKRIVDIYREQLKEGNKAALHQARKSINKIDAKVIKAIVEMAGSQEQKEYFIAPFAMLVREIEDKKSLK